MCHNTGSALFPPASVGQPYVSPLGPMKHSVLTFAQPNLTMTPTTTPQVNEKVGVMSILPSCSF